ncbi:hypothetical protein ACOJBO_05060 [Rhizobium beringeri]
MTENEELTREIELLADRAESDPETGVDIKALAVGLWASFNEFSIEEIEDALRDAWRTRRLAFLTITQATDSKRPAPRTMLQTEVSDISRRVGE